KRSRVAQERASTWNSRAMVVGLLHPGEMGAALGAALARRGVTVVWASEDRSHATSERATTAGFEDVGSIRQLAHRSDVIVSVCPPHAAAEVAESVAGFRGIFVDANAIAPETTRAVGAGLERFVDGGIVGAPPRSAGTTRLYLSGPEAAAVAEASAGPEGEARVLCAGIGEGSSVAVGYAAWTKGTA